MRHIGGTVTNDLFVPVANPLAQYQRHRSDIKTAIDSVLEGGRYILGSEVEAFEKEFSAFCGAGSCTSVASGTDALVIALRSCGIRAGDEVVTVSHTAVATVAAIELTGATPVFVDIDRLSRCMSPAALENALTPKTRAILPVHIFGQPAAMEDLLAIARPKGIKVIEDCAQAHGAVIGGHRVGTFGDAAAFSFYPTKNLGAIGDGGAVVSTSDEIATRCRELREYGWRERYISSIPGLNSRLDELQAAILRIKLRHLEEGNERRRSIAKAYTNAVKNPGVTVPTDIAGTVHAMHLYVIECDERERVEAAFRQAGIGTARHYPVPVHLQPAYSARIRCTGDLRETERLYRRMITLPMYPELTDSQVQRVCDVLERL